MAGSTTMSRKRKQRRRERKAAGQRPTVIPADRSQQAPHNSYSPVFEYRDAEFTCVDCGVVETWTAQQQKWWYETAKGPIQSRAIRCRECRRKRSAATGRNSHEERLQERDFGEGTE